MSKDSENSKKLKDLKKFEDFEYLVESIMDGFGSYFDDNNIKLHDVDELVENLVNLVSKHYHH